MCIFRFTAILIFVAAYADIFAAGPHSAGNGKCPPSEYTLSNPTDYQNSWTYSLCYDTRGRLTADTMKGNGAYAQQGYRNGQTFSYAGDTIFSYSYGTDTVITIVGQSGLPVCELHPFGIQYLASLSPDGRLERLTYIQPHISKKGSLDSIVSVCDSIVYIDGDIVSYRLHSNVPGDSTSYVQCSYYAKPANHTEYDPMYQATGLSSSLFSGMGMMNAPLFSSHLIKRSEGRISSIDFIYDYDKRGRIQSFGRHYKMDLPNYHNEYSDYNRIKYPCE